MLILAISLLTAPPIPSPTADTACVVMHPKTIPAEGRKSPLDSLTFMVDRLPVKLCYGRPSSRGRVMIGGEDVPYDTLWRTGANEPTTVFSPIPLLIAGVRAPAGIWTLYTVPGKTEWQIIVNRSTTQWGKESNYTPEVRAQEAGRGRVKSESLKDAIESFTIRSETAPKDGAMLVLEWEHTRVRIPVERAK